MKKYTATKKYIFVTFAREGIHCYPAAATDPKLATGEWDDVQYLAVAHRHLFGFRVQLEVFHNERDVEFQQFKRQCEKWIGDGTLSLNSKSCETIGDDLYQLISEKYPNRDIKIEVNEDGENGSITHYELKDDIVGPAYATSGCANCICGSN